MKKMDIGKLVNTLGVPVLIIVLGCIMLFNPDSPSALIAKIIGWVLVVGGGVYAVRIFSGRQKTGKTGHFLAVAALALGIWMLCNPLVLASMLGRFLGILLLIRSLGDVYGFYRQKKAGSVGKPPILSIITAVIGLILFFLPLSASRMVFSILGLVLICIGVAEAYDRLKGKRYLEAGSDPNIIDAL